MLDICSMNMGCKKEFLFFTWRLIQAWFLVCQALAATQTPGEAGKRWFQGTADAVRQFHWLFEVTNHVSLLVRILRRVLKLFIL